MTNLKGKTLRSTLESWHNYNTIREVVDIPLPGGVERTP